MKIKIKVLVIFLFSTCLFVITSCSSDDEGQLSFPTSFVYKKASMDAKGVYEIKNNTGTRITGNIGSFVEIQKQLTENLDTIMQSSFDISQIIKFELLSSSRIKVSGTTEGIPFSSEADYSIDKNKLIITDGIDESVFEINAARDQISICTQINWESGKFSNGAKFSFPYFVLPCESEDPIIIIKGILAKAGTRTYDTISVNVVKLLYDKQ